VVIVTPRLVQPSVPGQVVASPLDQTLPANDPEFFALGQMEVTPRIIQTLESRASAVGGPYGFIIELGDDD
jgi:pilus assembly protein CpaC